LIVAGPGTGKTRTLTHRIAYLIAEQGVSPSAVLAITFTNKAAEEMAERLTGLLPADAARQVTVQTFHAFAAALLRQHGGELALPTDFVIASEADQRAIVKQLYPDWSERIINGALEALADAKNQLQTADEVAATATLENGTPLADLYRAYEAALRRNGLVDFDDLILLAVRLLASAPAVRRTVQTRYRWISVDEYQDINLAQYRLLRLLVDSGEGPPVNLCAIGDPDQAIYGFRGADRGYFLRFQADFVGAQLRHLHQNYRSTQAIIEAATQVIAGNADETRLRLWSDFVDQTRLTIHAAATDRAEAEFVVHQIEQMVGGTSLFSLDSGRVGGTASAHCAFGDIAILYRTNAQTPPLIEALTRSGIPFQTTSQRSPFDDKLLREVLAYLQVVQQPQAALPRETILAAVPKRAAIQVEGFLGQLCAQANPAVADLLDQVRRFLTETLGRTLDDKAQERLVQLRLRARPYDQRLGDFLEALALQREADLYDPRADRVTLMTLHAAKGLEFPVVFIVGCEETLLPLSQPGRATDVEEERRLFYVGITRAGRKLALTHAQRRLLFGQWGQNPPSRFLADIEQTLKELAEQRQRAKRKKEPELAQLALFG
jgi:DNA helicase-2/ATP-dependent DNA helicase PcrA